MMNARYKARRSSTLGYTTE